MKVLKMVLIACSLSAAVAHAESAPGDQGEQVAQASVQRADSVNSLNARSRIDVPKTQAEQCVGPVSFCNIYFGS